MENLIGVINKLQDVMSSNSLNSKFKLPQLVVLGSQSSGKSSIIESIVGKDFLPRGSGIITRRPLILQLKNIPVTKEWAEFNHIPHQKFEDFSKVCQEIESETHRIAGKNKGISNDPIILKIFSNKVIDLTLVDLPGIVNNPIGDQPEDIEEQVKNLILEYISNPNALILAITPANTDIANSDGLKMAKLVDPNYLRTIGIITKIDLMDKGTDTVDVLMNKTYRLKLGYIGVICRSQEDNINNKSIEESIKAEEEYFLLHEEYNQVKYLLGNKTLKITLSKILIDHIKISLPSIKNNIYKELYEKENEMKSLGNDPEIEKNILNSYILTLVNKFTHTYNDMIEGKFVRDCSKYFIGGSRINYIFQEIFKKEINYINPFDSLSDEDIRTAIKNSNGLKPSLFIPEAAFEVLIKQQIERFANPSLICVKKVYEELKYISNIIEIPEISKFKKLENKMKIIMENVLDNCLIPTNQMIINLVNIEKSYINTYHPDFMRPDESIINIFDENSENNNNHKDLKINNELFNDNKSSKMNLQNTSRNLLEEKKNNFYKKISNKISKDDENEKIPIEKNIDFIVYPNKMRPGNPTNRDLMETLIIKNLINSYYQVVKKNINDLVPKTIMCFLVNQSKIMAEKEMVSQLFKSEELESLLVEDPNIAKKRKICKDNLQNLKKSLEIISDFNEFSMI